ncbi:MAG: hypothetical protein OSB42_10110 [Planctomycetota bacterium]|nr:hypothetical protein [Planctomycetota bacterium]
MRWAGKSSASALLAVWLEPAIPKDRREVSKRSPQSFAGSLSFADGSGRVDHDVDLTNMPTRPTSTAVQTGETWNFQVWYRDDMGGTTTDFSLPTRIIFH